MSGSDEVLVRTKVDRGFIVAPEQAGQYGDAGGVPNLIEPGLRIVVVSSRGALAVVESAGGSALPLVNGASSTASQGPQLTTDLSKVPPAGPIQTPCTKNK